MACQSCNLIDRRQFLESAVAALGAGALLACSSEIMTTPAITPITIRIADFAALASVGGVAIVDGGSQSGEPIAVARTGATTFVALSLICPHKGVTVTLSNLSGITFICPGHGAEFTTDGTWSGGQPTTNLGRYPLTFDQAAGTLHIG